MPTAHAAEVPGAVIVLEGGSGSPGSDPGSVAPPRLLLLEDGQVFVGGTGRLESAKLEKPEQQALRRSADAVRKAAGKGGQLDFGSGAPVLILRLPEDGGGEIRITGDPAAATVAQQPAAAAVLRLLRFDHPGLRPYTPASYALSAREERLAGGCRPWAFAFPIEQALTVPRVVSAAEAEGWPTGAWPASVCLGDSRYVVTLRPLLPNEQP